LKSVFFRFIPLSLVIHGTTDLGMTFMVEFNHYEKAENVLLQYQFVINFLPIRP